MKLYNRLKHIFFYALLCCFFEQLLFDRKIKSVSETLKSQVEATKNTICHKDVSYGTHNTIMKNLVENYVQAIY